MSILKRIRWRLCLFIVACVAAGVSLLLAERGPNWVEAIVLGLATLRSAAFLHMDSMPLAAQLRARIVAWGGGMGSDADEAIQCMRCLPFWMGLGWAVLFSRLPTGAVVLALPWALAQAATLGALVDRRTWGDS